MTLFILNFCNLCKLYAFVLQDLILPYANRSPEMKTIGNNNDSDSVQLFNYYGKNKKLNKKIKISTGLIYLPCQAGRQAINQSASLLYVNEVESKCNSPTDIDISVYVYV
ncbi:hypothetical protein HanHA300_Chr01g0032981 [Helianthus annuus]|nr:hypothetical protein HanHA300_Chr01g0032981 [Helianthus annuus]